MHWPGWNPRTTTTAVRYALGGGGMTPQCQQAVANIGNGVGTSLRGSTALAGDMTAARLRAPVRLAGALDARADDHPDPVHRLLRLRADHRAHADQYPCADAEDRHARPGGDARDQLDRLSELGVEPAAGAPDQIASIILGGHGSATQQFGDKIDVVFARDPAGVGASERAGRGHAAEGYLHLLARGA